MSEIGVDMIGSVVFSTTVGSRCQTGNSKMGLLTVVESSVPDSVPYQPLRSVSPVSPLSDLLKRSRCS